MKALRVNIGIIAVWLCAAAIAAPATAGKPDLTQAAPDGAVAMIRATGLRAQWTTFFNSPAWKRLEQGATPELGAAIRYVREQARQVEDQAGLKVEEGLASVFGADVLLAYYPAGGALFVARTDDPVKLQQVLDLIQAIERNEGRLKDERTEDYHGVTIFSATVAAQKNREVATPRYHAVADDLLFVSSDGLMVRNAVDALQGRSLSLAQSAQFAEAAARFRPGALVQFYVATGQIGAAPELNALVNLALQNPMARVLAQRAQQALAAGRYAIGDIVADADRLDARYVAVYDETRLPEALRAIAPPPGTPLDIVRMAPPSAVLLYADQSNKPALWRYIRQTLTEMEPRMAAELTESGRTVAAALGGLRFEEDVLPQLGDQAALIVLPGDEKLPPSAALAIELEDTVRIPAAIRALAGAGATLNKMEADKAGTLPKALLQSQTYEGIDLLTLALTEPKVAGKLAPTMFVLDKYMVVCTVPDAARAIIDASRAAPPVDRPLEGTLISAGFLDLRALSTLIARHREFLIAQGVKDGKTPEKAKADLASLELLLSFAGRLEWQTVAAEGVTTRSANVRY